MFLSKVIKAADLILAKGLPEIGQNDHALVTLAFHSVLNSLDDLTANVIDPYQPMTLSDLERVITVMTARGYSFITGQDIATGTIPAKAAWLTFDDGYANNLKLVGLLEKFDVPATVFVSSKFIQTGNGYWWDSLYRHGILAGRNYSDLAHTREALKALRPDEIEDKLMNDLGPNVFKEPDALARPMTPDELATFARHPLIEIGNHTHSHAILTTLSEDQQRIEIATCQKALTDIIGKPPVSIAYPNGNTSPATLKIARSEGLKVGVTCLPHISFGPLKDGLETMALGRFAGLANGKIDRELTIATVRFGLKQRDARKKARQLNS